MKRILSLLLVLSILFCFAACAEEEKGDLYYLYQLSDGKETITAAELANQMQAEGINLNEMYWLRLYEDGSGTMCSAGTETAVKRSTTHIWPVNDENAKMEFTLEGDMLTVHDGDAILTFKKN